MTTSPPPAPSLHDALERHGPRLVLLLIVLLAFITAERTFTHDLWGDEFRTWRDGVEKPLSLLLTWQHNPDHAPGGHLLARIGATLFPGTHPWDMRLGSWLCGLGTVWALWWTGRTVWTGTAGLAMALMFVVDSNIGFQMTQARMYAPLMFAATLSIGLAASLIVHPLQPRRRMIGLGFALAAGIWFHGQIFAVVLALLVVGVVLVAQKRWRRVGVTLLIGLGIGCLFGVQGIIKIASRHDAEAVFAPDITKTPLGQLEDAIVQLCGKKGYAIIILITAILGCGTMWRRPQYRPLVLFLVLIVSVALLNLFIAVRYRPIAHARYLTVIQPAIWLAMSAFIVEVCRSPRFGPTLGTASLGMLTVLTALGFQRQKEALHWESQADILARACHDVRKSMKPGDRLVIAARGPYAFFGRYYGLDVDDRLDDAVTWNESQRVRRQKAKDAGMNSRTIWLLAVVQPMKMKNKTPMDDPATAFNLIAKYRGIDASKPRPELKRTTRWSAVLYRFEGNKVEQRGLYLREG